MTIFINIFHWKRELHLKELPKALRCDTVAGRTKLRGVSVRVVRCEGDNSFPRNVN